MAARKDSSCQHRVAYLIPLLLVALAPILGGGCAVMDRGQFVQRNMLNTIPQKEVIKKVDSVDLQSQIAEKEITIRASYSGIADYGTAQLVEEVPYRKKMAIGFFPGFVTSRAPYIEMWVPLYASDNGFERLFGVVGSQLGLWAYPIWGSAFSIPSILSIGSKDYTVPDAWSPSEHALLGCYKVLKPDRTHQTKRRIEISQLIQEDMAVRRPLPSARVQCAIPSLGFQDAVRQKPNPQSTKTFHLAVKQFSIQFYVTTDTQGLGTTRLRSVPNSGYYDVTLTLSHVSLEDDSNVFAPHIGQPQRSRVYIGAQNEGEMPLLMGGSGIPPASWSLESVAVARLTANGTAATEAATLTEWLHAALVETGYFKLTSRDDIEKILKEQNFQRSDRCDDTECLIEMGQLCAVSKMIGGSVGVVGRASVITLRIIDVESGETTCAASGKTQGGEDVLALVRSVAEDLCRKYAKTRGTANE